MAATTNATAAARARLLAQQQQQAALLGMHNSPAAAVPGLTSGSALSGRSPQVNATNQSALAPNGDINQSVTNENTYHTNYVNVWGGSGFGGAFGSYLGGYGAGVPGAGFGSDRYFIDPYSGMVYAQKSNGIMGWLSRLFRGY